MSTRRSAARGESRRLVDPDPLPARLAAALKLMPTAADQAEGYETPAEMVLAVVDRGSYWSVATVDGAKHRVAREAA